MKRNRSKTEADRRITTERILNGVTHLLRKAPNTPTGDPCREQDFLYLHLFSLS
jgi:hypothetical protein